MKNLSKPARLHQKSLVSSGRGPTLEVGEGGFGSFQSGCQLFELLAGLNPGNTKYIKVHQSTSSTFQQVVGPGTEYQSTSSPPGQLALLVPVSRISPTPDGGSLRGSGGRRVMHGRWVGVEWWTWKGVYSRMQSQSQELGIGEFGQILPDCKRC